MIHTPLLTECIAPGLQFFTTNVGFVGIDYNSTRSPFLMKDPDNSNLWITAATSVRPPQPYPNPSA